MERNTRNGEREGRDRDDEEDIPREEISKVLKNLKVRKAPVIDEAWKYGGERLREWAWVMCNRE